MARYLISIILALNCLSVLAEELVPEGNQQISWKRYLESINDSTNLRCSPFGVSYFVYDFIPETGQYPTDVQFDVKRYQRIVNGELKSCTAEESLAECGGGASNCGGYREQYTKCTDRIMSAPWVPYVCRNAGYLRDQYSLNPDSPYSEVYLQNQVGDYHPNNACGMNCGDPIQLNTGNSFQKILDYKDPLGRGFDFYRFYNSRTGVNSNMLQKGWTYSYLKSLLIPGAGSPDLVLLDEDGALYRLSPQKDSTFKGYIDYVYDSTGNILNYVLVYPDHGKEYYSSTGRIQKIEKWGGATLNFGYAPGLTTITDDLGRKLEVQPGSLSFVLPNSAVLSHDRNSMSFSLNGALKDKGTYYDLYLMSLSNSLGNVFAKWNYDMRAKKGIQSIYNSGANRRDITYSDDLTMVVKDEFNNTYYYTGVLINKKVVLAQKNKVCANTSNGCINETNVYEHDSRGNTTKYTSATEQACYFYDSEDRLIKVVEGLSPGASCSSGGVVYRYEWHPTINRVISMAGPGVKEQIQYDANYLITNRSVQATEDLTGQEGFSATVTNIISTENYSYNEKRLITQSSLNGVITNYEYNSNGFITSKSQVNGLTYTYANHRTDGLPTVITTPSGLVVNIGYDGNNNVTSLSTDEGESSTWTYLGDGTLTESTKNGITTTYTYDSASRLVSKQNALLSLSWIYSANSIYPSGQGLQSQGRTFQKTFQYNELGQPIVISN